MKTTVILLPLVFGLALSIFVDQSSSSSSSESRESHRPGGGRGNGGRPRPPHRPHRPHPPRPRPPPRPVTKCEAGWTRVRRQSGGWCIRIFQGVLNQPRAEVVCQNAGARLSALESQEERKIVEQLATTLMTTTSAWTHGSVRFGIQRSSISTPFYSTDGNVKNVNGINWSVNEPSTGNAQLGYHNCVLMWILVPGTKTFQHRGHGQFFSKQCGKTWNTSFRSFVCGKPAI